LFLVTVPLGLVLMCLALRHLPAQAANTGPQAKAPLVSLTGLRENALWASLVMNALVATVMMATLVVGPFFLSGGLHLTPAWVGATMAVGPALSMLSGFPSGRLVDRWGAQTMLRSGLLVMLAGTLGLVLLPAVWGWTGYLVAMAFLTPGYQLFLSSNNTAVMTRVPADRRGEVSGLLNLARNLGLIAGASVMGTVFAAATPDLISASPAALLNGLRLTFAVAAGLLALSLATAFAARPAASRL
ncbi:MAG TPA: MFS transporter, partial [Hydrogenophaga sp.]|nr:MFS transporter [Hydrogenophaga sp.]